MAKKPKELQQLAALPAELEPELKLDDQNSPQGVVSQTQEVRGDQAIARAYLAERGLTNPRFSRLETAFRGAAVGTLGLGVGTSVASLVGSVIIGQSLFTGVLIGMAMVPLSLTIGESAPVPRVVKSLAAQITQARREKLRSWASTNYGTEVNDELLVRVQSELAARGRGALTQLQNQLALTEPETPKPKVLQP